MPVISRHPLVGDDQRDRPVAQGELGEHRRAPRRPRSPARSGSRRRSWRRRSRVIACDTAGSSSTVRIVGFVMGCLRLRGGWIVARRATSQHRHHLRVAGRRPVTIASLCRRSAGRRDSPGHIRSPPGRGGARLWQRERPGRPGVEAEEPMTTTVLAIGTRKGLWLARSEDGRRSWTVTGPQLLMQEVPSIAFDTRGDRVRLLVGGRSEHWGPTVFRSDDLGETWDETTNGAIRFPADTGVSLERVWQLTPDSPQRPDVVWAGCEPTSLWRSTDGGASFELVRGLWDHPHRPQWAPGFGGAAVHTVLPDPASDRVLVAMSTGGVYAATTAAHDGARATPASPRTSSRTRGPSSASACTRSRRSRRADRCTPRTTTGSTGRTTAAAPGSRSPTGCPATSASPSWHTRTRRGTAWVIPLKADGERVPPDGRLRVHRTRDGGASWQELGSGLPDTGLGLGAARRGVRRRRGPGRGLLRHPRRRRVRQRRRGRQLPDGGGAPARRPRRARSHVALRVVRPARVRLL